MQFGTKSVRYFTFTLFADLREFGGEKKNTSVHRHQKKQGKSIIFLICII